MSKSKINTRSTYWLYAALGVIMAVDTIASSDAFFHVFELENTLSFWEKCYALPMVPMMAVAVHLFMIVLASQNRHGQLSGLAFALFGIELYFALSMIDWPGWSHIMEIALIGKLSMCMIWATLVALSYNALSRRLSELSEQDYTTGNLRENLAVLQRTHEEAQKQHAKTLSEKDREIRHEKAVFETLVLQLLNTATRSERALTQDIYRTRERIEKNGLSPIEKQALNLRIKYLTEGIEAKEIYPQQEATAHTQAVTS